MNDETLILYYYGDGLSDDTRAAVESALENDATVRARYRELSESLDRVSELPEGRAPAHVTARWHDGITRAAAAEHTESARHHVGAASWPRSVGQANRGREAAPTAWHFPSFAWGALAAALAVGIGIALYVAVLPPPPPPIADTGAIDGRPVAPATVSVSFTRGLETHLRQTRQDIARLTPNDDDDRATLIMDIVRQNRLFQRSAHEHDAEDIARVLRAFEPVLLHLAGGDISTRDATALKAKLEFELGVVLTKMQRRDSDEAGFI